MRFNRLGQALCRAPEGLTSVDRRVIAGDLNGIPASGGEWVDDTHVIIQYNPGGGETLRIIDITTGLIQQVSDIGANKIIAGGGRWCAWLGGTGMYGAITSSVAYPAYSDLDGNFGIVARYADGIGFSIFGIGGQTIVGPNDTGAGVELYIISGSQAVWQINGDFRCLNAPVPVQAGKAHSPKILNVQGDDWVVYWVDQYGLIAHPTTELKGYIIQPKPIAFNHDAIVVNSTLRVGYCTSQGEPPDTLVVVDVDFSQPRVTFDSYAPAVPAAFSSFTAFSSSSSEFNSGANTSALVQPQLNLLEDDIVYRLSLLATNVLQPIKNQYPNIIIKSGFRQVNTGIGQHELGEAVDIQIINQTPELLFEVANWIQNNVAFDQLILCFTNIGDGQPWIHVSFSPDSLRHEVLTKDLNDAFQNGLFLITPLSGEAAAQAQRTQAALDQLIDDEITKISARVAKMGSSTFVQDDGPAPPPAGSDGSLPGGGGPGGGGGGGGGGTNAKLVACVQSALGLPKSDDSSQSSPNITNAFEVTKRVAWLLKGTGCGLLVKNGGDNIVQWNGYSFAAGRVCFPNGQIYKILTDVEGGTHTPTWDDNGTVDPSLYVAAIDPGTDINMNWTHCAISTTTTSGSGESEDDPIIAMSLDPVQLAKDVRASAAFYGRTDDDYWIGLSNHAGQFSNGKWYAGWNRYFEVRMDPNNDGSADPNLAGLPAIHRA